MAVTLKGITWNHSRGLIPLQAASQRFSELYPEVAITWHKRSLQEFADFPIEKLTESYDLLIIDHPWVGTAAATGCVLALDRYIPQDFLTNLEQHSVGFSHESYNYDGHQWALAIDAASPVASYRSDLLEANRVSIPETWEELISLAKAGKVAVPAIPIDLLMNFYTFCIAAGAEPFTTAHEVVDAETGIRALQLMKELYTLTDESMFSKNPIAIAEIMSNTDDYWYCPFAYGYTNYSRKNYSNHILTYDDVVSYQGEKLTTTLGGTGLSVSAFSSSKKEAVEFAKFVCSPVYQSTEYILNGGQPGYKFGWKDEVNNRVTNNFFYNTLNAITRSYIRPRHHGYLKFQDEAGDPIQQYLRDGDVTEHDVIVELNKIYKHSLPDKVH